MATPPIQGYAENKLAADEAAVISNVGLGKKMIDESFRYYYLTIGLEIINIKHCRARL